MRKASQLALMLAGILSMFVLAVAPVGAEQGTDTGGSGDTSNTSTTTGQTSGSTGSNNDATETADSSQVTGEVHDLEGKARALLETERKNGHEQSQIKRQASCKAHQAEINTQITDKSAAAQRHLNTFEGILSKVQAFYTNKNLNVTNYATLLAAAQSKQADAQTAVDALKALNVSIDCTQPDPAQSVATVKTAVDNARTTLQAYREAIKALIVALEGASTSATQQNTSTTGGNQ